MNTHKEYKHWEYYIIRYVPTTPKGGGEIEWQRRCDYRDIYLPSDIDDPATYLEEESRNEFCDCMEYCHFSEVTGS